MTVVQRFLFSGLIPVLLGTLLKAQPVYDTLNVVRVSDGVLRYEIREKSVPWSIQVVEADITRPDISLETVLAGDKLRGYETLSSMAGRRSYENHRVIAAVNGDFYDGEGRPTNTQILNGEILRRPNNRAIFGFNKEKELFINTAVYSGFVVRVGDTLSISGLNEKRGEDALIFYNSYWGNSTLTNKYGTEMVLRKVEPPVVNGVFKAVVAAKMQNSGDAPLTDSSYVLSGHGVMALALQRYSVGDTLRIMHKLAGIEVNDITGAVGGNGVIMINGVKTGNWPERHPRTAVGFDAARSKLYLVVVDGRQEQSAGMTLQEMGDFMETAGIFNALNLDGGGSTTLVVDGKVVNSPSLGRERTVSNGLLIILDNRRN